jgi:hypothetical protein
MLTIASNVRKSTSVFAQALHESGIKVKRAVRMSYRKGDGDFGTRDALEIRGLSKFNAYLVFDYETGCFNVRVWCKRGIQMIGNIQSFSELKALFSVWNLGAL